MSSVFTPTFAESTSPDEENNSSPAASPQTYAMPVTPSQERFWALNQLQPGNPALNMSLMWQCHGDLRSDLLRAAFRKTVERHEILRTTFALEAGALVQVIHPSVDVPFSEVDLSHLPAEERRAESGRLTRLHSALAFDLAQGPLLALQLVTRGPREHLLLVTLHHIICDGVSNGILMRDVFEFYKALLLATEADLPALPIQFADYAVWLEGWRQSPEHGKSLGFWQRELGTNFSPLRVPFDADASEAVPEHLANHTGAIETLLMPAEMHLRAQAFCQSNQVTLNVFLLTVFLAWLRRSTEQSDLTIGYPTGNRSPETEDLIGLFMNIQPIRVHTDGDTTFLDLLRKVQSWTVNATEHEAFPFEDLVHDRALGEGADAFQIPIFFLYQPSFMQNIRILTADTNLLVIPLRSESPGAVFDLMMAVVDRAEEGPRFQLEYNPRLYKGSTVQRFLRTVVSLADSALTQPEALVDHLGLQGSLERANALQHTVGEDVSFGPFQSAHEQFVHIAKRHPGRIAVECAGEVLTYGQLLQRATSIAQRLRTEMLEPGDRVALCMSRSADLLASLLAVLMSGCCYVPLDARYPEDRIRTALADSDARLVLTDRLSKQTGTVPSICTADIRDTTPFSVVYPSRATDLAYVIYTSGSTGKPKGVAIEHGALFNLLHSVRRSPGISETDVLVAITTISFDIATLELLLPLMAGAKLVIAADNEARSPSLLLPLLKRSHATMLQATPGAWRALIDEGWTGTPALKVLCGGEAMSRDLADNLISRSNSVWNMYGPTETTIWSSATRVQRGDAPPSVDCVMPNTQFYVLDQGLNPMPLNMPGELYIGGAGLARGYWNRPDLTARSFVTNPFGPGRLYRTGDLAMWQDGPVKLKLLGRADFQVKVRGYRIELGEIEHVLNRHSAVREAVVVQHVLPDRPGQAGVTRMIAYCDVGPDVKEEDTPALVEELETELSSSLPEYMMPNVIVALPELPRLLNGKINRKDLPDVFQEAGDSGVGIHPQERADFQWPQDYLERQLADVWQTTLGIPRISTRASFFSLGVGSLAALRLITKMNRIFAMDLGLATLISSATIESIAKLIRDQHSTEVNRSLVPIFEGGSKPPLFILHGVGGNIINFIGMSRRLGEDRSIYAIQSQALLTRQSALLRIEDMAAFYIREMKSVQPEGPYHLLGYSFGGTVVAEMAYQLHQAGEKVALTSMLDARTQAFQEEFRNSMTTQTKFDRRVKRLFTNTTRLAWKERIWYIGSKIMTRSARLISRAYLYAGAKSVPSAFKSVYDVNYVAMSIYKPRQYPGKLVLFRATEQDYASGPRDMGWLKLFPEGIEVYEIPGDHERIFLEPSVDELARRIRMALDKVDA